MEYRRSNLTHRLWLAAVASGLALMAAPAVAAAAPPPVNTAPPTIQAPAGQPPSEVTAPQVGRVLMGTAGQWTGASYYSYQWEHCDTSPATAIPGAIDTTYRIADGDVGHTLCFLVTASSSPGSSTPATSAPTGVVTVGTPLNRSAPTISGATQVGQTLTASSGVWDGTSPISYTYQWRRCNSSGASCGATLAPPSTSPTYVLQTADLGHTLVAYVTATNVAGSSSVHSHATAVITSPTPIPPPNPGGGPPPAGGTGQHLHALLLKALAVHGRAATIGAILKHRGYTFSFPAPSSGRLVITWLHRQPHAKTIVVATLNVRFARKGNAKVRLILTGKGRGFLRRVRKATIAANGRFTPTGQSAVLASRRLTLTR